MKKKILMISCNILFVLSFIFLNTSYVYAKEVNIDEVLKSKSYNNLSETVKDFVKDYYEENKVILLTKDLAKSGQTYLNPKYIEYLDSNHKEKYGIIPSVTAYISNYNKTNDLTEFKRNGILTPNKKGGTQSEQNLPSKFDLRDVDGKNFVTPNKNQGNEGLCWAYATSSLLETHDLIVKNKSYDSTALLFSEKQMDYALSTDGIIGGNKVISRGRKLSSGAQIRDSIDLLAERLGGVLDTWNNTNANLISTDSKLNPFVVFNRANTVYEIGETVKLYDISDDVSNVQLNENYRTIMKNAIKNNGGAIVAIGVNTIMNAKKNTDFLNVYMKEYVTSPSGYHGVHLIGWDDDYEYNFCSIYSPSLNYRFTTMATKNENGEFECWQSSDYEVQYISGKGVWIAKNSWGNSYSYIYIPYESRIEEFESVNAYTTEEWDNSYHLHTKSNANGTSIFDFKNYNYINDEKAKLLKISIQNDGDFGVYFSHDGQDSNYTLIYSGHADYAGYKSIDISSSSINLTKDSTFKITSVSVNNVLLFTNNNNALQTSLTSDFIYNLENDKPSKGNYFEIETHTDLKNINDNSEINYKIKYKDGNYLPNNSYIVSENIAYYNMVTPSIKLKGDYAIKGDYELETWSGNNLINTSSIQLEIDFMPIDGDGSENNPWKIRNVRHFNMIKNALNDNYIMMNDIDFYYDTQDPNGLFYTDKYGEYGWIGISDFKGNFDGNGKTVKNILANSGIFSYIYANDSYCLLSECGVHDLKVDTLINNYAGYDGGIIGLLIYENTYKYNFNNLSVVNATFNSIYDGSTGGIVGNITISDRSFDLKRTVLKIDNWYSEAVFRGNYYQITGSNSFNIGGLIGRIDSYDNAEGLSFSLNNMKSNVHFDLRNDKGKKYNVSDTIGAISNHYGTIKMNNIVGKATYEYNDGADVTVNAFVGNITDDSVGTIRINGAKSTLNYISSDLINITNYEYGLKPYELARANYDNIEYYEDKYYVYDEPNDKTSKVTFGDKFNVYSNKIPTLKKYPEKYSDFIKNYAIRIGEIKSINDLIANDTNYKNLNVFTRFECNLDICNNETDDTIISVPTTANEYSFSGKKSGSTTLILYDDISGYLDVVNISVLDENEYKLILNSNDGNTSNNVLSIKSGDAYGELPEVEREGYSFLGWFTESITGDEIKSNTIFNGNSDTTIYAHWQKNAVYYTVKFDSKGGSAVADQRVVSGNKATRPEDPTKEGYVFVGWKLQGDDYNFNNQVTSDITLYAAWEEKNNVIVTFDSDGGTEVPSQTIFKKQLATEPEEEPIKEGFLFIFWASDDGSMYDFSAPVTEDITLKAIWIEVKDMTVYFDSQGGSIVNNQTIKYNSKATKPSNPTKEGYTFVEWQLNGNDYDFNARVKGDMTLTAVWEINKYTVTFNSDGGSNVVSQTINYNGKATKPANPTKTGYKFVKWQLNGKDYDFNTAVTGNITLKAVWDKNEIIDDNTLTLKNTLENNGYSVNGSLTSKFTLGDSIMAIKNKLGNDVTIETDKDIISTGAVIKKGNESYTVVIKGDLTGDGKVNSGDLLRMRKYLLEEVNLTGAYKEAGIIESNNEIKSLDLLRLRQYLLGEYEFK